jgi:NodT family efflux transporter outer membrane factor (OMF) lipoprotein
MSTSLPTKRCTDPLRACGQRLRARRAHARVRARGTVPAAVLLAGVLAAGCTVGPDFVRPATPAVSTFVHGEPVPATLAASGAVQSFAAGAAVPRDWWLAFRCAAINAAVDDALTGNPTFDAALASLRQSEHALRAGAGVFFPQIEASAGAARERYAPVRVGQGAPPSIFNLFTLSATVSYTLDIWGGQRRMVEGLRAQTDASREALAATYLSLTANVVNTTIARAAYADEIAATRETIAVVRDELQLTDVQVRAGTAAYAALLSVQSALAALEATLPPLEQKRAEAEHLLAALGGMLPADWHGADLTLADITLPSPLPATVPSDLVRARPDILQAEATLHVASANVGVATANLFPSLTLSASGGYGNTTAAGLFAKGGQVWSVAGNLTAPLFHGGALWYGRKAALDALDAAWAQYRQVVLAAFEQVADALRALEHDTAAQASEARALDTAREALRLMTVDYKAGTVDYLQVLAADQRYHQASIAYLQTTAARLQDTVALYAALGGGWHEGAAADARAVAVKTP